MRRQAQDDPVLAEAVRLAAQARTPSELLTLASQASAAAHRPDVLFAAALAVGVVVGLIAGLTGVGGGVP